MTAITSTFTSAVFRLSILFMVSRQWQVRGFGEFSYESEDYTMAHINITYLDPRTNRVYTDREEVGKFSVGRIDNVHGVVVHVSSDHDSNRSSSGDQRATGSSEDWHYACDFERLEAAIDDLLPPRNESWIALVKKGRCSVDKKIANVIRLNASAVLVYNNEINPKLIKMHHNRKDYVAVFITKRKAEEIIQLLDNGTKVTIYITVGTHTTYRYANINRTSVLFVSISFIVLMIISLAWLVFYYIQRFRYIHAKDILARRLCNAAKKALAKIPVKTLKIGDKETESDFECCAVCIERYFTSDVVRTLPCKHTFHKSCVDPWLLDQRTCPMCKMDILKFYGLLFSNSQDSIINIDIDGTLHQFQGINRRNRADSVDEDIMFNDVRRSSNRSTDFVILEVSNLADLGSSAGPAAGRSSDYCVRSNVECGEECRTLLGTDVQSDAEENSSTINKPTNSTNSNILPPNQIGGQIEDENIGMPVESTSHDLLVILNSPSSDTGAFSNMAA